jgi:hypothetical protein
VPLPWLRAAYRALPQLAAQEQLTWLDALTLPHATKESGEAILARLQHLAAGGEAGNLPGAGTKYDEHGRLISETYEEFTAWAVVAGLIPQSDLVA